MPKRILCNHCAKVCVVVDEDLIYRRCCDVCNKNVIQPRKLQEMRQSGRFRGKQFWTEDDHIRNVKNLKI